MNLRRILLATTAAALIAAPAASAHITASVDNPSAGAFALFTMKVPHGCGEAATTKLEMQLPEGMLGFVPGRSPFYDVEVETKGTGESELPVAVTWTATTPLPSDRLDVLLASVRLPEREGQVNFPVVATCEGGKSESWTQIAEPGGAEPEHPAPSVTLGAAGEGHGGGESKPDHAEDAKDDESGASPAEEDETETDLAASTTRLEDDINGARTIGFVGLVVGALGLLFGLVALRRKPR